MLEQEKNPSRSVTAGRGWEEGVLESRAARKAEPGFYSSTTTTELQ